MDEPAYRVSACRAMFGQLDRLFPARAVELRAQIPAEALSMLEQSLNMTWIPAPLHHQIIDRAFAALGEQDFRRIWKHAFLGMMRLPLYWPVVETAIRLFGATPSSLARWTPRGYTLATRNLGRFDLTADDPRAGRVVLELSGYPPALAAPGANVAATAGSFEGFLELTEKRGGVEVTADPARGFARYELRWQP